MSTPALVETEQRSSFSKLQQERVASRCIKPNVVTAKSVHVIEREALGARDHHGRLMTLLYCCKQLTVGGSVEVVIGVSKLQRCQLADVYTCSGF